MAISTSLQLEELKRENEELRNRVSDLSSRLDMEDFLLTEREKEFHCVLDIDDLEQKTLEIEEYIEGVIGIVPSAWRFPHETQATVTLDNILFGEVKEKPIKTWHLKHNIFVKGVKRGTIDIYVNHSSKKTPFLKEENNLLQIIAHRIGQFVKNVERKHNVQQQEIRSNTYFNSNLVGMAETSLEKGWLRVNHKLCNILGYKQKSLMKMTWTELTHPEDIDVDVELFNEILNGKRDSYSLEKRFIHKNGHIVYAHIVAEAVRKKSGEIDYFVALVQDISAQKNAQDEASESKQLFHTMADASPDFLYVYDLELHMNLYANKNIRNMLGYSENELLGVENILKTIMVPDDFDAYLKDVVPRYCELKRGEVIESEYRVVNAIGEYRYMQMRETVLQRDEKGTPTQIVGLAHDISNRKELEKKLVESEEHYRHMTELSRDLITLEDEKSVFLYVSPSVEQILGYHSEALIGMCAYDLFHPDDIEMIANSDNVHSEDGSRSNVVFRMLSKDKRWIWVESISHIYEEKGKIQRLSSIRDISERKAFEESLERSNKELEQFAYVASHDLREPLRMVTSFSQLIQQRYSDSCDETAQEFLQYVIEGATRMGDLINDLLQLSRVATVELLYQRININTIIKSVLLNLDLNISETETVIEYREVDAYVDGVESQLIQLFQNVISNGIKFSPKGGQPSVDISVYTSDYEVTIDIKDQGIGIAEEFIDQVFKPFRRLHSRDEYDGNGIGLAVCKKIVDRHCGTIDIISTVGVGSHFIIVLPISKENTHESN